MYPTEFLVEHNLPLAVADHIGPLLRKMFPNNAVAKRYRCGQTKTRSLVRALDSNADSEITTVLKTNPYSLATDGSNDIQDFKLYPLVVKYFDDALGRMCTTLLAVSEAKSQPL